MGRLSAARESLPNHAGQIEEVRHGEANDSRNKQAEPHQ
jgi:hypothetical protein